MKTKTLKIITVLLVVFASTASLNEAVAFQSLTVDELKKSPAFQKCLNVAFERNCIFSGFVLNNLLSNAEPLCLCKDEIDLNTKHKTKVKPAE